MRFLKKIFNLFRTDQNFGSVRSNEWPRVRKEHLKKYPRCAITGKTKGREVHHVLPVWLFPKEELNPDNLITLHKKWHFLLAHFGNYRRYNPLIREDAKIWNQKIKHG